MIRFLLKGLIRDGSRSLFPIIVIGTGVAFTVLLHTWIGGFLNDMIWSNATLRTGHLKIMTLAYAKEAEQLPNDLAIVGVDSLLVELRQAFPDVFWTPRIRFGGLIDIPDAFGETRSQGPAFGLAVNLLGKGSREPEILNLKQALVRGRLPEKAAEVLLSDDLANALDVDLGETATLISSSMYGSLATYNFRVVGTVRFGIRAVDRGAIICDIEGARKALGMENAASEIVGFFSSLQYNESQANLIKDVFNETYRNPEDEFSSTLLTLREQDGLAELLDIISYFSLVVVGLFVFVMFIVLWNAGLMGSLRRYGEMGVRLAFGEDKGHVYRSLLVEALAIGLAGSVAGTTLGLALSYYLQSHGVDFNSMLKGSTMVMSNVLRAQVTPTSYVIGFIPGIMATLLGTAVAGIGIYKRQTSQLFRELEA